MIHIRWMTVVTKLLWLAARPAGPHNSTLYMWISAIMLQRRNPVAVARQESEERLHRSLNVTISISLVNLWHGNVTWAYTETCKNGGQSAIKLADNNTMTLRQSILMMLLLPTSIMIISSLQKPHLPSLPSPLDAAKSYTLYHSVIWQIPWLYWIKRQTPHYF